MVKQRNTTIDSVFMLGCCAVACLGISDVRGKSPTLPSVQAPYYRVVYPASAQEGELAYGVSYTIWLPPGVKTLRGILVHQHGCGEGACRAGQTAAFDWHWQALAAKHSCALMGPSYEQPEGADCQLWCDPRHGSGKRFLQALDDLANQSGHPELARVPWGLWGHSGGATWVGTMLMLYPERCAAVWMRSGIPNVFPREGIKLPVVEIPDAAMRVPTMCNLGTQEGVTVKEGRFAAVWPRVESLFQTVRKRGALMAVSVDPISSHDCGNQRYLAIPWFDDFLGLRLPKAPGASMQALDEKQMWLAPLLGEKAVSQADYTGDPMQAIVLPTERTARAWEQYTKDTNITDTTVPMAPYDLVRTGNRITWKAEADLESGIASFVILQDDKEIATIPAQPPKSIGRPNVQKNSYSDTPSQPLAEMTYQLADEVGNKSGTIRMVTVNTVGLKSLPSEPAR